MVNLKGLKPGNFLTDPALDNQVVKLIQVNIFNPNAGEVDEGGYLYNVDLRNLQPIMITPDLLQECGFVKVQEGNMAYPEIWRLIYRNVLVLSNLDLQSRDTDEYRWLEGNANVELRYLHELQNLFAVVSGDDLPIDNYAGKLKRR